METVVLRMPVDEETTVEEVDEYFVKFAKAFKTQVRVKEKEEQEKEEER